MDCTKRVMKRRSHFCAYPKCVWTGLALGLYAEDGGSLLRARVRPGLLNIQALASVRLWRSLNVPTLAQTVAFCDQKKYACRVMQGAPASILFKNCRLK